MGGATHLGFYGVSFFLTRNLAPLCSAGNIEVFIILSVHLSPYLQVHTVWVDQCSERLPVPWRAQLKGESRLSKLCQEKTRSSHAGRVHHVHRTKSGLQNSLKYAFEDGELSALRTKNNSHQRRFHFPQASPQRLAGCLTSFTLQSRCRRTLWLSSLPLIMMQWSPIWLRVVLWLRSVAENQVPRKSQKTQIQIWAPATEVAAGRADYAALVGPPLIQFYEDRYGIKWDWLLTIIPKVH